MEELFICSTHDYIMFFTSKGRCFRLKGYEIGEGSRTSRGTNIVNLLQMDSDEKVTALIKVGADEYDMDDRYLVMVTRRGVIKRHPAVGLPATSAAWDSSRSGWTTGTNSPGSARPTAPAS